MNLEQIAPIIQKLFVQSLTDLYPFGLNPNSVRRGAANKRASGTLINSISANVTQTAAGQSLTIDMAGYAQFVNEGRLSMTPPPVEAIMQWLTEKGINVRDERGRFVQGHRATTRTYNKAKQTGDILPIAFAIQKSIGKFGIRETNFIGKAEDSILQNNQIRSLLGESLMDDLQAIINKQLITY